PWQWGCPVRTAPSPPAIPRPAGGGAAPGRSGCPSRQVRERTRVRSTAARWTGPGGRCRRSPARTWSARSLRGGSWSASGGDAEQLLEYLAEGGFRERAAVDVDEAPVCVVEGGDGHRVAATERVVQPAVVRPADVAGQWPPGDVVPPGHVVGVAGL